MSIRRCVALSLALLVQLVPSVSVAGVFEQASAQDEPVVLPPVEDWIPETIELPPGFAPGWPTGTEMLLFPPGWRSPDAETFWSYGLVAWIDEPEPNAERVVELVETYYNGLMGAFGVGRDGAAFLPARVTLHEAGEHAYRGRMRLTDGFATFEPIEIHLRIETEAIDTGRSSMRLVVSPKADGHAIWDALGDAAAHIVSERAGEVAKGRLGAVFDRMPAGEWRLGVMNGSVQQDQWSWGVGGRALIGHTLNSKGDGESTSGVLRVIYQRPGDDSPSMLAISRGGLVWEGSVTPVDERVVFDMELTYGDRRQRRIVYAWDFDGPDRYTAAWLHDDGSPVEAWMTGWVYLRAGERPSRVTAPRDAGEAGTFAGVDSLLGRGWASDAGAAVSMGWVRHADVLRINATLAAGPDGDKPEYEAFVYTHPGHGGLRYLAVWSTGRVDEGDAKMDGDGRLELSFNRLEADAASRESRRFELTEEGMLREHVWRDEDSGRVETMSVFYTSDGDPEP